LISKEILNPDYAFFTKSEKEYTFQPTRSSILEEVDNLDFFRFIGKIVGKALYEN